MKKFALLALGNAAIVAYATAHIAHHNLGIPFSALREQALICAGLIVLWSYSLAKRDSESDPLRTIDQAIFYLGSV